jgi:hypothetical protein
VLGAISRALSILTQGDRIWLGLIRLVSQVLVAISGALSILTQGDRRWLGLTRLVRQVLGAINVVEIRSLLLLLSDDDLTLLANCLAWDQRSWKK